MCQPVTWIAICIFSVFTLLSFAFHFLFLSTSFSLFRHRTSLQTNLSRESENLPYIFLCSFPLFLPASLSSPTFLSISSDSFSSSSTCSPMRDADAVGKVGAAFWGLFPPLRIFHKPGVFCCWPIKGNYDRIMPRGQLWRGKAHVNGQHAVGPTVLSGKSEKPGLKLPFMKNSGTLFLYTKLSRPFLLVDSRLSASHQMKYLQTRY